VRESFRARLVHLAAWMCLGVVAYGWLLASIEDSGDIFGRLVSGVAAAASLMVAVVRVRRAAPGRWPASVFERNVTLGRLVAVVLGVIAAYSAVVVAIAVASGKGHSVVFWGTIVLLVGVAGGLGRVAIQILRVTARSPR
jgi:hypothetical protein